MVGSSCPPAASLGPQAERRTVFQQYIRNIAEEERKEKAAARKVPAAPAPRPPGGSTPRNTFLSPRIAMQLTV